MKLELWMWDSSLLAQTGVLAITFAFDICCGKDPCSVRFDHKSIRHHLTKWLEDCKFTRFPALGVRTSSGIKRVQKTELHCSCRLPEKVGDKMAECEACNVWYHQHCMDIPSEVFDSSDVPWRCKECNKRCLTSSQDYSYSLIHWHDFIITGKEYERVVGWEGSDAVSPRDGVAWILRNSIIIPEELRTLQVSLLILKCKTTFVIHLFTVKADSINFCCACTYCYNLNWTH